MKGFTLVEVLVVMAIFTLMLGAIYGVLNVGNSAFEASSGTLDLTQEARTAMYRLVKEVRGASTLAVNNASGITFSTPSVSNVQYYLTGTKLVRVASNATQVFASHVSNLTFSNPGGQNTLLQVLLTVNKSIFLRSITVSLMEEVRLRNE